MYKEMINEIIHGMGGTENFASVTHCMTRLRMVAKDESKVDFDYLNKISGVIKVVRSGGQIQCVIGEHVGNVYKELMEMEPALESGAAVSTTVAKKKNPMDMALDFISSIFMPVIPAFIGAGILKGILMVLSTYCGIDATSSTYVVLYDISDSLNYFLPILVGWSVAKKLKVNIPVALSLIGVLLYPGIIDLLAQGGLKLFGIPVYQATYSYTVMSAVFVVVLLYVVDKGLQRVIPRILAPVFVPLLDIVICAVLSLLLVAPLGAMVGNLFAWGYTSLMNLNPIIAGAMLGGLWQVLVIFGMHTAFTPITLANLSTLGKDSICAIVGPAGVAQLFACLGVGFSPRTKNPETRKLAKTLFVTCFFGCAAEPALYGINLKYKKPFIIGVVCGTIAGGIVGATGGAAMAPVPFALYTIPAFAGVGFNWLLISGIGAALLAFIAAVVIGVDEEKTAA